MNPTSSENEGSSSSSKNSKNVPHNNATYSNGGNGGGYHLPPPFQWQYPISQQGQYVWYQPFPYQVHRREHTSTAASSKFNLQNGKSVTSGETSCKPQSNIESGQTSPDNSNIVSNQAAHKSSGDWSLRDLSRFNEVVVKFTKVVCNNDSLPISITEWEKVAESFSSRSVSDCKRVWEIFNPGYEIKSFGSSVLLCKNVGENSLQVSVSRQDSVNDEVNKALKRKVPHKANWTENEKQQVYSLQKDIGNKWTQISKTLNTGKTPTEVKNFWNNKKYRDLKRQKKRHDEN